MPEPGCGAQSTLRGSMRPMLECAETLRPDAMRLSFINESHDDLIVTSGGVNLGSAVGNDVVLDGKEVSPWHARIFVDARGIVLQVLDPTAQTHVNARPVLEKALLRRGDILHLGQAAVAIKADTDTIDKAIPSPGERSTPQGARVTLRGLSGAHAGRAIAVGERVVVGSTANADIVIDDARLSPRHSAIEVLDNGIWLRSLGSAQGANVNGIGVLDARLRSGDQLSFARHQFLVEAPGFNVQEPAVGTPPPAKAQPAEPTLRESDGNAAIGWLLGVAALIAIGLYLLIHRGL